jgi:peptide/nickel transport system substrate-binding protein
VPTLEQNANVKVIPYNHFWIHIATPNFAKAPTDKTLVRRAIQAALDMEEIMEAATDGAYTLEYGFQPPGRSVRCDGGSEYYNVNDKDLARQYLQEAGYNGEELVLLTNRDYNTMYNAALIMSEQLKEIGMNVRLEVQDWPTTIATRDNVDDAWNYHFTGWGTNQALGYLAVLKFLAPPNPIYDFTSHDDPARQDQEFNAIWNDMLTLPTEEERADAFCRAQIRTMENGLALPFGWLTKFQAFGANVENYVPFRIPRMYNVYFAG